MTGYKRYVGTGLVVGTAAVAAYAVSRRLAETTPGLIDWQRVQRVAVKACRGAREIAGRAEIERRYAGRVAQSEELIAGYIGQELPRKLQNVHVLDRPGWIDANIENFRQLFEPFEQMHGGVYADSSAGTRLFGSLNQLFLSQQMGILLGYLGQRVLGQYDLTVLGHEPLTSGKLYFVEPNIAHLQEQLHIDGEEFRLWIALHETTHAFEFEANPWVRAHLNALIHRYFETVTGDFLSLRNGRAAVTDLLIRILGNVLSSDHMLEWLMTHEQRTLFREMQALMCLLEGYSNHVMQAVGAKLFPSYESMKQRFEARSKDKPPIERLMTKLIGLDIKYQQYTWGERFVGDVVRRGGIELINRVWDTPEHLPTLSEIKAPERWIERMSHSHVRD